MNNEVIYKVNAPFINKTDCDNVSINGKIINDSDQIIDNYEDSELITDSESSDLSLPINNIGRMMKLSIPGSAKISRESKMLMQQISKDFIGCISSHAGEICTSNKRRVLNGEDIINALSSFGFGDYTDTLINYLNIWRGVKQSRNIKSYSNIYRSNNSSLNFNENYQIPTDNSQHQFFGVEQKFENNYNNKSLIDDQKPINNEYNKYFIQNNISTNNQQINYTNLPKFMNNAIYEFVNSNIDKNINSQKYSEDIREDTNIPFCTNKGHINTLLLSPTRSINFLNESSPDTPKSTFPLNQYGKRKRIGQEESKIVNIVNNNEQCIDFNVKYNTNYNNKNSTDIELIENNTFQENKKSTINFSRYNNLEYSSNQYKQDEIFLNKNETSLDNYFSSDLYIQEESENDSEYNTYPSGLFIS